MHSERMGGLAVPSDAGPTVNRVKSWCRGAECVQDPGLALCVCTLNKEHIIHTGRTGKSTLYLSQRWVR